MSEPISLVALGASAGGLAPIEEFLESFPGTSGASVVVIQHLSPDHESMMESLLGSHTEMPVRTATDGMVLAANHVYLIPPGTELKVENRRFVVEARRRTHGVVPKPIDVFFESMAEEYGPNCAAVVLSGTGNDGTHGIAAVHRAGGLTLTQDHSANFDGMTTAAAATGMVDASLAPPELAVAVALFIDQGRRPDVAVESPGDLSQTEDLILGVLTKTTGIRFKDYKPGTIQRRIERRRQIAGKGSLEDYLDLLGADRIEVEELAQDLLIDVTQFFRDSAAFDVIEHEVAPRLVREAAAEGRPVRIWVAGCATGEEAYSLAMIFLEAIDDYGPGAPALQTFASDISEAAIEHAGQGIYSETAMTGVSPRRRGRFFTQVGERWKVTEQLRSAVTFARQNLLADAPFTRIDLASCRNMLIYFRTDAQNRAIASLSFTLRMGGVLFLGSSESVGPAEPDFSEIDGTWRIFRKESDLAERALRRATMSEPPGLARAQAGRRESSLLRAYDAVLESQFVGGFLVSSNRELLHTIGIASEWLGQPTGRPTMDVLAMIRAPELRLTIGSMLRELEAGAEEATPRPVPDIGTAQSRPVLMGRSIREPSGRSSFLLWIRPSEQPITLPPIEIQATDLDLEYVGRLEADLNHTRESLRTSLEAQEAYNEELDAANEELIASNEELQSTNEELLSVNEELRTLNDESQSRLEQVLGLSADLEQLMSASEVGVIFLTDNLEIRRFNDPARRFFRVRDTDNDRPFDELRTVLPEAPLHSLIRSAVAGAESPALTMRTLEDDPRQVVVRARRYELSRDRSGILLAVVDISEVDLAEEKRALAMLIEQAPFDSSIIDAEGRWVHVKAPVTIDGERIDLLGHTYQSLLSPAVAEQVRVGVDEAIAGRRCTRMIPPGGATGLWSDLRIIQTFPIERDGETFAGVVGFREADIVGFDFRPGATLVNRLLGDAGGFVLAIDADDRITHRTGDVPAGLPTEVSNGLGLALSIGAETHREALAAARAGTATGVDALQTIGDERRWRHVGYVPASAAEADVLIVVTDRHDEIVDRRTAEEHVARLESEIRSLEEISAHDVETLAQRNQDLDNFAHVAAHDLKAPIRSVRSYSEIAMEQIDADHPARATLEKVVAASQRMSTLVESLLDYASIDSRDDPIEIVDLDDAVHDVCIDLRAEIDEHGAEVVSSHPLGSAIGSAAAVRQVLANLISNAVKFRSDRPPVVEIAASENDDGVVISVTDNGVGFEPELADRLFEPFQRLHTSDVPGNGVGLATVKRIVQRHGGKVWAVGRPDAGASFHVLLPADPGGDVILDLDDLTQPPAPAPSEEPT